MLLRQSLARKFGQAPASLSRIRAPIPSPSADKRPLAVVVPLSLRRWQRWSSTSANGGKGGGKDNKGGGEESSSSGSGSGSGGTGAGAGGSGSTGPVGPGKAFIDGFIASMRRQMEENKELKENVKLLAAEAEKISESDAIKRAREMMDKANREGSGATSKAIKAVSDTMAKAADNPIARAATGTIKATASAVGSAAEAAVRPITETEAYKQVSADLAQAIQEASSRYGGVSSKRYRELLKQQRSMEWEQRMRVPVNEEALGMVLREDSTSSSDWGIGWEKFRDNNPVVLRLFDMSKRLAESDNLVVSWGRYITESVRDRLGGIFEETETSKTLTMIKRLDPTFNLEAFMREAREFILPEILEAWLAGDHSTLSQWCGEASVKVLTAPHGELVKQGLVSDSRLLELKHVDLTAAKLLENQVPVLVVSFQTQETILYRDRVTREVRLGKENAILRCNYVVVLTLDETARDHPYTRGWKLVDQAKHSSGTMV